MTRSGFDSLADVLESIDRIRAYTRGGANAFRRSSMARDAVIARLIQIGQAVKDAQDKGLDLHALAPGVPWRNIAGMRDRLAHKYWSVDTGIVWGVVETELVKLEAAVKTLLADKRRLKRTRRPAGKKR